MAKFVHLASSTTAPVDGWLTIFSATGTWTQVSLSAQQWVVRGAANTAYEGWTVTVSSSSGFGALLPNGYPSGAMSSLEVRQPDGALVVTADLAGLNVTPSQLQSSPALLFAGDDQFTGSSGADVFWGGPGNDSMEGGAGNDVFYGVSGVDSVSGGAGDDTVTGVATGTIDGGAGNDRLIWSDTSLTLRIGAGGVTVSNIEQIEGRFIDARGATAGLNFVGSGDHDSIVAGNGDDTVTGGWGADIVDGGQGNDLLDGSNPTRPAFIIMSQGQIHVVYETDTSKDGVNFASAGVGVKVDLSVTTAQDTGVGIKTLLNFENIYGSNFADTLTGDAGDNLLAGEIGADSLSGGDGADWLSGGDGDDLLVGGTGNDVLAGGAGFDRVDYTTSTSLGVRIDLGETAGQSDGFGGLDQLSSIEGVIGTRFSDTLTASDATGVGAALSGNPGEDRLIGASFADVIDGGLGADTMTGGGGADKFVLRTDGWVDQITDFNAGQDYLLLFDAGGGLVNGSAGILVLDRRSGLLTWDPDSDAGSAAPMTLANLGADSGVLTKASLAVGFQPSALRTINTDGSRVDVVLDWGNQSFDTATSTYAPSGALKSYEVRYDTGGWSVRTNDVGNLTPEWATVVAEYDKAGQLFAYSVYKDDGGRTLWLYDTDNSKTWSRVLEEYDGLTRLTQQSAALDDGTAWERHIDAADTQPWAYYIDNYANGRLLNHTFYNANGTVFAG